VTIGPELITAAANRSGYFSIKCIAPDADGFWPWRKIRDVSTPYSSATRPITYMTSCSARSSSSRVQPCPGTDGCGSRAIA
jgi:hypothetical protein